MKTKLLAIDLDGTLLSQDKKIAPETVSAIVAAKDAGIAVVLASGRIRPSMSPFAQALGLDDGPMICGNGTVTYLARDNPLYQLGLQTETLEPIISYAREENLHLNVYTPEHLYFLRETAWGDLYRRRVETVIPTLLDQKNLPTDSVKVLVVSDPDTIAFHGDRILEQLSGQNVRSTESEPEYLEFMDASASKGLALMRLAEALGIDRKETAAIGDYLNDLELLEFAGISAAVENAHPLVKSTANMVVSSNDRGGVSEFIRQIVLKQYE